MADIFLSYSQKDSRRARQVAEALRLTGWDVWWDVNLSAGARFRHEIAEELRAAKCVVVLWSRNSLESDFVIDEAEEGRRRGVLVQAIVDDIEPPYGFRGIQWANLVEFAGDTESPGMTDLMTGIQRHVSPIDAIPEPSNSSTEPDAARSSRAAVPRRKRDGAKKKKIPLPGPVPRLEEQIQEMNVVEGVSPDIAAPVAIQNARLTPIPGWKKAIALIVLALMIAIGMVLTTLIPRSAPSYVIYIAISALIGIGVLVAIGLGKILEVSRF